MPEDPTNPPRHAAHGLPPRRLAPGAWKEKLRKRDFIHPARLGRARPYVELRARSAFSFLLGASAPEDLIEAAAARDLPAMALVDVAGVYGAPRFYKAARAAGVRALVGAEVVLDESAVSSFPGLTSLTSTAASSGPLGLVPDPPPRAAPGVPFPPRLTLLVRNHAGYKNLCRLLTAGALGRPKGEARVDWKQIEGHAEGLHCLTGGDESPLSRTLASGGADAARRLLERLGAIFPCRVHVELQRHQLREEEHRNQALAVLAARLRLPVVATGGVCYARTKDKDLHDVFTAVRNHTTLDRAGRLLAAERERLVHSPQEMSERFADLPGALDESARLAAELDFTLADLGYRFPDYPLPAGETADSFLRQITWNAARSRFRPLTARAQAQISKELAVIEKLGLAGYFLIVWDIVQFCRREKILAQGRGSAANSAVCYALGITAVDPVKMDLLFERFLSEERGEWPDIDIDLPSGDER